MKVVDTSVVVTGFASWHAAHQPAATALAASPSIAAHGALEAFSVLTRLPPPHRAPSDVVTAFLSARFPEPWLTLPSDGYRRLLDALTGAALRGGATCDALIGWTARHHGASVVTLDRRAASTYDALGVSFDLVD